jgi:hypothetical protein
MDPNKNLTNKQTVTIIGSILGFSVLLLIFASCAPKQQAVVPTPAVEPSPSPVAIATPAPTPKPKKTIQGRFIRTGEDFRHDLPAEITMDNDGTISVTTNREWQTAIGTSKSQYRFVFKTDGRWTEQETSYDSVDGKTYPFSHEGGFTLTKTNGGMQINANADDAPRPTGQPWIVVTFNEPNQQATIPPKTLEELHRDASPAEVKAVNKIQIDRASPYEHTGMLNGPDPDYEIPILNEQLITRHVGFSGDPIVTLKSIELDGATWVQVRFPNSGAEGWVTNRNLMLDNPRTEATTPEPQQQTDSSPSQANSNGRCNSPNDTDSRGRRCGARAKKR